MSTLSFPPEAVTQAQRWLTHPNNLTACTEQLSETFWQTSTAVARLPFDACRSQYSRAVGLGLLPRSLLASRDFERALGALERWSLGPLARRL